MLVLLDWLLTLVHVSVVLGFLVLWIPSATVRLHRWLVVATAASWLGLGLWHGLGYCFLTDWHWRVKRARGVARLPNSFIKYAADHVTGLDLPPTWVDVVTGTVFVAGCGAAVYRYVEERRRRTARAQSPRPG